MEGETRACTSARRRRSLTVAASLLALVVLLGLVPAASAAEWPAYYPSAYKNTVEASKKEGGEAAFLRIPAESCIVFQAAADR